RLENRSRSPLHAALRPKISLLRSLNPRTPPVSENSRKRLPASLAPLPVHLHTPSEKSPAFLELLSSPRALLPFHRRPPYTKPPPPPPRPHPHTLSPPPPPPRPPPRRPTPAGGNLFPARRAWPLHHLQSAAFSCARSHRRERQRKCCPMLRLALHFNLSVVLL